MADCRLEQMQICEHWTPLVAVYENLSESVLIARFDIKNWPPVNWKHLISDTERSAELTLATGTATQMNTHGFGNEIIYIL